MIIQYFPGDEMSDRFTEKAENALNRSVKVAESLGHTYIGSEHILLALSEDEYSCAALILKKNGIVRDTIYTWIKEYSGIGVKSTLSSKDLTPRARKILENSYNHAVDQTNGTIGTEHILLALIEEKECVAGKLFKSIRANTTAIRDDIYTLIKSRERILEKPKREGYSSVIKQYGKNLCELAKQGKFDPVIGRDKEIDRITRILSRKNKNNPCLIGEAGVGKTAIVEGLAQRISENNVPASLLGKTIISLDLTSMVAGAKYRGDFEERIKNIINEVVKHRDIILFIDEIHTIVGAGAAEGSIDASNILKPQLSRGDIQIIGATTYEEYRKYIERDAALERRFQPIQINEPTSEEAISMLKAIKPRYEEHHGVEIDDQAIVDCVLLSSKYMSDRYLPDKAIDVLDEACASASNKLNIFLKHSEIIKQNDESNDKEYPNLFDFDKISAQEYPSKSIIISPKNTAKVTPSLVKEVISEICGIPISQIKKSLDYEQLEEHLSRSVRGQNEAIKTLVSAIKRADLGIKNQHRPRGIFMFIGESGVGKTALAVELEKSLFFNSSSLIRFDMSEFSERQSISKLIGSPPGYVGHEEGGALTEAVKKRPHSVVLFDEIEKADKEILNVLLQIADHGYLRDSSGRSISFLNTVIIATSNIGSANTHEKIGFENYNSIANNNDISILKKHFSAELINRFDEIIHFSPLSKDTIKEIIRNELDEIAISLSKNGCSFTYGEDVVSALAKRIMIKGLGARPILREIHSIIENQIIDIMIKSGNGVRSLEATVNNEDICISEEKALKI